MATAGSEMAAVDRLARLRRFLEQDPGNPQLAADAAAAALDAGEAASAISLIDEHGRHAAQPPALLNLKAVAALQSGRPELAEEALDPLVEAGEAAPETRLNLAWAKSRLGKHEEALDLIDDALAVEAPGAAVLKLRSLHHLGRVDEALALGGDLAERRPGDRELMSALASLAIDAEQPALARSYAERAGGTAEARAATGMLLMEENDVEAAVAQFSAALEDQPDNARANIGLGTALLASGKTKEAIGFIERGAAVFGDHPGSWLAAGWAHFVAGDQACARDRFDKALAADENFAEAHGALAAVDASQGLVEDARRRIRVALRLDRSCFSAALAKTMLLQAEGRGGEADRLRASALATPVTPGGQTLASAISALAAAAGRRP